LTVFRKTFGMRLSGLTGHHLARLPANRKARLAEPAEISHADDE
jgi:hypothetical protein